jgi:hypothetical protein
VEPVNATWGGVSERVREQSKRRKEKEKSEADEGRRG